METVLRSAFSLSKAIWVLCIAVFLSIAFQKQEGLAHAGLAFVKIGFTLVSLTLSLIHLLACFAPSEKANALYSLSAELADAEYLPFNQTKVQRGISILGDLSSAFMYFFLMLFVLIPSIGLLPFLLYGLVPTSFFFFLSTFTPRQEKTGLGRLLPEARK